MLLLLEELKQLGILLRFVQKLLNWNPNKKNISIIWEGEGVNEIGRRPDTNQIVIRIDSRYFRPTEVDILVGD